MIINDFKKAHRYLKESLSIALKDTLMQVLKSNYKSLSKWHFLNGDMIKALSYYKSYYNVQNKLWVKGNQKRLSNLKVKFDYDRKEKEVEFVIYKDYLKRKETNKTFMIYAVVVSSILLLLIIAFIIAKSRKKNINAVLKKQNEEKNNKKNELKRR